MPANLLYILHALVLLVFLPNITAQEDWENAEWNLTKDKNNIRVFTAEADNSDIKMVKVEAIVEGKWENIVPVFKDINNYDKWVYKTERSYPIRKISDSEILYYIETDLPWPAKNRDTAVRMKISKSPEGEIIINNMGEPDAIPATDGNVRVQHFNGKWIFRKAAGDKIRITYYLNLDPGGSLPSWIVNMFIAKGPYDTMSKLSDIIKSN